MAKANVVAAETDWRAESDLSTLIEAEKIKKDPKRYAKAKELAKSKLIDVAAVASESND